MFEDIISIRKRIGWISVSQLIVDSITNGDSEYKNAFADLSPIRHIVDCDVWHILCEWDLFDKAAKEDDDMEYPCYKVWLKKDYDGNVKVDYLEKLGKFGGVYNI